MDLFSQKSWRARLMEGLPDAQDWPHGPEWVATPYQSYAWQKHWSEAFLDEASPVYCVEVFFEEQRVALMPIFLDRTFGFCLAHPLGGQELNCKSFLYFSPIAWDQAPLLPIFETVGRHLRLDGYLFRDQLTEISGFSNPLLSFESHPTPSSCGIVSLANRNYEAFVQANMSKESQRKMRSKRKRLEEAGSVSLLKGGDGIGTIALLDTLDAQKAERARLSGIPNPLSHRRLRFFLERLLQDADAAEHYAFYGLQVGEELVATLLLAKDRQRWSGVLNSITCGPLMKNSPGDFIFLHAIEAAFAAGASVFDFGIGEAHYKDKYADTYEPLYDVYLPLTTKGVLALSCLESLRGLKRHIKQNRHFMAAIERIRRYAIKS